MNKITIELTEDQANYLQGLLESEFNFSHDSKVKAFATRIRTKLLRELTKEG